ncbi:MAG: HD domain-containing protein, partial [Bacteroidales bacterium]|nr:HD domain-containing protein [Bacteroidales bacterium]
MTGYKKAFSEEERRNLADVVQYLNCEARPLFDADEWKQLRHYLHLGIRAHAYDRDEHGVSLLLLALQSCRSVYQDAGLRQATMVTALLYPLSTHDAVPAAELRQVFGNDAAHLIECMTRVMRMYDEHDHRVSNQQSGTDTESASAMEDE